MRDVIEAWQQGRLMEATDENACEEYRGSETRFATRLEILGGCASLALAGVLMNFVPEPKSVLGLSIVTITSQCMKPMRSIWQSCTIILGMAADELNLGRDGEVDGRGSLYTAPVLKCGV